MGGEELCHVQSWDHVTLSHHRKEEELKLTHFVLDWIYSTNYSTTGRFRLTIEIEKSEMKTEESKPICFNGYVTTPIGMNVMHTYMEGLGISS